MEFGGKEYCDSQTFAALPIAPDITPSDYA